MVHPEEIKKMYFKAGEDWFFDRYESSKTRSKHWFIAFIFMSVISILLAGALIGLTPLKTVVPVLIHQNKITGEVWTPAIKTPYVPEIEAQVQSDIVRFLTTYLSYSANDINQRYALIKLLSSNSVLTQYDAFQSNDNPNSPVNALGETGESTIQVQDIVFLDKEDMHEIRHYKHHPSKNLAKADLIVTTVDKSGSLKTASYVATLSWEYQGTPQSQADAWNNWNGFTVTMFRLDPKNVEPASSK